MDLLRCLSSQPQAAAQATAVSLGAYHSVALMAQKQGDPADLQLYAFGRGEHKKRYPSTYATHDSTCCRSIFSVLVL